MSALSKFLAALSLLATLALSCAAPAPVSDIEAMARGKTKVYQSGAGEFTERSVSFLYPKEWSVVIRRSDFVALESPHREGLPRLFVGLWPNLHPPGAMNPDEVTWDDALRYMPRDTPETTFDLKAYSFTVIHGVACLVLDYDVTGKSIYLRGRGVIYAFYTHTEMLTLEAGLTRDAAWNEAAYNRAWEHYRALIGIIAQTVELKDAPSVPDARPPVLTGAAPAPTPALIGEERRTHPIQVALYVFVGFVLLVLAFYGAYKMRSWED